MPRQWHFEQDEKQQWYWKHPDGDAESAKSFASAGECMLDAVRFAVERRRALPETTRKDLLC